METALLDKIYKIKYFDVETNKLKEIYSFFYYEGSVVFLFKERFSKKIIEVKYADLFSCEEFVDK